MEGYFPVHAAASTALGIHVGEVRIKAKVDE